MKNLSLCLIYVQVEFHPFQQPLELVEYCRKENIVFEGYCPLAKGQALTHPSIMELAQKYGLQRVTNMHPLEYPGTVCFSVDPHQLFIGISPSKMKIIYSPCKC